MASALNKKRQATLDTIYSSQTPSDIRWKDIERLVIALGGDVTEGRGSRVRFWLNGARAVLHRPHPEPTAGKPTIVSVRKFLINAGVRP